MPAVCRERKLNPRIVKFFAPRTARMALSEPVNPVPTRDPRRVRCSGPSRESSTIWILALLGWRMEFVFGAEPGWL